MIFYPLQRTLGFITIPVNQGQVFRDPLQQWRGESEAAREAARLMAPPPPPPRHTFLPLGVGRVSCRS